jgi:oligosaccharyltransferase complex subunit epsilon
VNTSDKLAIVSSSEHNHTKQHSQKMSKVEKSNGSDMPVLSILGTLWDSYHTKTPKKAKMCDLYAFVCLLVALVEVVYVGLAGTFPFNSFLATFFGAVGSAMLTVSLRAQPNRESAFAEYVVSMLLLFICMWNFMG